MKPRIETKYIFNNADFAINFLKANFLPDTEFPMNYVYTLHFDTDNFDSYYEKVDGNLIKSKLRVRWYSNNENLIIPEVVFIENKIKKNKEGLKYRKRNILPEKIRQNIMNPHQWFDLIEKTKLDINFKSDKLMTPIMLSSYKRFRFIDKHSNSRVSLDQNIKTHILNFPVLKPKNTLLILDESIMEIKSPDDNLPIVLKGLAGLGAVTSASFSKYERLLSKLDNNFSFNAITAYNKLNNFVLSGDKNDCFK